MTIKQHLAAMRSDLESRGSDCSDEGTCCYKEFKLLGHLSAIEAELDRPMKSADSWVEETKNNIEQVMHPTDRWCGYLMTSADLFSLVKRVQSDARTSKLPEVDLRKLAKDTAQKIHSGYVAFVQGGYQFTEQPCDTIHAALKKARGGV